MLTNAVVFVSAVVSGYDVQALAKQRRIPVL